MKTLAFAGLGLALVLCASSPEAMAMSKKAAPPQPLTDSSGSNPDMIWVGKSDEAKSCAKERGVALDTMAAQLESSGIKIAARKKVPDGKMRIQSCGADKGDMNGYQISRKDLDKAKDLGFAPVNGNF